MRLKINIRCRESFWIEVERGKLGVMHDDEVTIAFLKKNPECLCSVSSHREGIIKSVALSTREESYVRIPRLSG